MNSVIQNFRRKAFTLVELLVVISIIALLLAILMPALIKTRDNAKRIICSKRLSQISLAMSAYASDCQDKIIMAHDPYGTMPPNKQLRSQLWHILLLPYIGKQVSSDPNKNLSEVFFCPQDKDPHPMGYIPSMPHIGGMTSFAPNGYYQAATAISEEIRLGAAGGYKFTQIRQSSVCMLMAETSYAGRIYDAKCSAVMPLNLPLTGHHRMTSGFYHSNAMNVMFVDGHIDHIKGIACAVSDAPSDDYAAGKYMFWPELMLPDADSKPEFWGPGYKQ
jgi:prepilin-type N-terminal cleavage/methylation domain-containing protein/prepilin-type processing-associated H-X9-DG protein